LPALGAGACFVYTDPAVSGAPPHRKRLPSAFHPIQRVTIENQTPAISFPAKSRNIKTKILRDLLPLFKNGGSVVLISSN